MMFIRFIVAADADDPWWADGVFTIAGSLRREGKLESYENDLLDATFDWFNENLPRPPFDTKREAGEWSYDAICWYLPQAKEPISRMWDMIAVLKSFGFPVQVFRAADPGEILYRDDFQVVAVTPRNV